MMFRGSLLELDGAQSSGKVMVFASGAGYSRLTAGQPAAFRAQISMPKRRDLTVAVLTAEGEPTLGDAAPIHRAAHHIRARFARARSFGAARGPGGMLPALVLGDTSTRVAADDRTSSERRVWRI